MVAGFDCAALAAGVAPNARTLRNTPSRSKIESRFIVSRVLGSISLVSVAAERYDSNPKRGCLDPE